MASDAILLATVRADVLVAANQLLPIWRQTGGRDGFVSWEVDPAFAWDPEATVEAVAELTAQIGVPNLLVKIPATEAGVEALEEATAAGHSVNVTLLFSVERYVAVAEAYLRGLERARAAGISLSDITSVASFFTQHTNRLLETVDGRAEVA
jgi:transaldolase